MRHTRSGAETEIRNAVVAKLRRMRPGARICHEVNCSGYGPVRFDLIAVDKAEIVAVEIKSEKDKLDRAPAQIAAMQRCAHHAIVAFHEKFLVEKETNPHAAHYERDGTFYLGAVPQKLKGAATWVYPERDRNAYAWDLKWNDPGAASECALPGGALGMLWRDELAELCDRLRIVRSNRATMSEMTKSLRWHATGGELTLGICAALRIRRFAEADEPIVSEAA